MSYYNKIRSEDPNRKVKELTEDLGSVLNCPCKEEPEIESMASTLVDMGYAKRPKAKWVWDPNGHDWGLGCWVCSNCRSKNDNLPGVDKTHNPLHYAGSSYCPECGAEIIGKEIT